MIFKEEFLKRRDSASQFFTFEVIRIITDLIIFTFFSILIYKETGKLEDLILTRIMLYIGIWIGFVISSFYIDKLGYLKSYRLALTGMAFSYLLALAFIDRIGVLFPIITLMIGIFRGCYWPIKHSYLLKEVTHDKRLVLVNELYGIEIILSIVLPVLVGSAIVLSGYNVIFILSAVVTLFGVIIPFRFNQKPKSRIRVSELYSIAKKRGFKKFQIISGVDDAITNLFGALILLLPYLFLKNEFKVGLLGSIVAAVAGLGAIIKRNDGIEKKIKEARLGLIFYALVTIVFAIAWNIPLLIFRSLSMPFIKIYSSTTYEDLSYDVREKVLGNFKNESAIEMNLLTETVYLIGRLILHIPIYLFFIIEGSNGEDTLRLILILLAPYGIITFILLRKLDQSLRF